MKIEIFCDNPDNSNTYLLINDNNECIVIDPSNNIHIMKQYMNDLDLKAILITHGHIDHFKTINELFKEFPCDILLHKNALVKLQNNDINCSSMFNYDFKLDINLEKVKFINDQENIKLGSFEFKVLSLFGHTDCSLGFYFKEEHLLFSGDAVFENTIGRTDLPTGAFASVPGTIRKIKSLPTNTIIYPGHDVSFTIQDCIIQNKFFRL